MVILISGTTHTGKTALAQRLLEKYKMPYFSLDHLKMGLIRNGQTSLTVHDDKELTPYLWPIVREIIKTAIENEQNVIVEGCYIPFDWQKDFDERYLRNIKFFCLVMSEEYIENNFADIVKYENVIEKRIANGADKAQLIAENRQNLELCQKFGLNYLLIDKTYQVDIDL